MAPSWVGLGGFVVDGPTSRATDVPSEERAGAGGSVSQGRGSAVVGGPQWFLTFACFHYASTHYGPQVQDSAHWALYH